MYRPVPVTQLGHYKPMISSQEYNEAIIVIHVNKHTTTD